MWVKSWAAPMFLQARFGMPDLPECGVFNLSNHSNQELPGRNNPYFDFSIPGCDSREGVFLIFPAETK